MPAVLERGVGTDIEEWWISGETMTYRGHTMNDYYPAFNRALENYDTTNRARGFTLLFGPGDYHFSNTLTLIRGMYLLGQGGHGQSAHGTTFRYADGIDGLHTRFADTPATPPISPGGGRGRSEYSVVENIAFVGNAATSNAAFSKENHGIWALAPIRISNCLIDGWGGNGIRMTSAPEGTAWTSSTNHSVVEHCTVQQCGWHGVNRVSRHDVHNENDWTHYGGIYYDGIYIDGANSNGSLFSAVHCRSNGRWGFYDNSGLGCTFVACMTHDNAIVRIVQDPGDVTSENLPDGGCYKVADADARSVFIGCYAESDQRPAEVSPLTLVLGGAMIVDLAKGQYLHNDSSGVLHLETGLSVWSRRVGREWVKGTLGSTRSWAGVAFEAVNQVHPTNPNAESGLPLNLMYDEAAKTWAWRHDAMPYMVLGTTGVNQLGSADGVGRGQVHFPQGILLGHSDVPEIHFTNLLRTGGAAGNIQGIAKTQQVRVVEGGVVSHVEKTFVEGYASVKPNGGNWNIGDRLWHINPVPGGMMGWVCTQASTPATPATPTTPATAFVNARWSEFGAIAPPPPP